MMILQRLFFVLYGLQIDSKICRLQIIRLKENPCKQIVYGDYYLMVSDEVGDEDNRYFCMTWHKTDIDFILFSSFM